jgi:acetyl esterase
MIMGDAAMRFCFSGLLLCAFFSACGAEASGLKKDIVYSEAGGEALKLDAYVPDGAGPFPIVVAVHGGGWTKGDKGSYTKQLYEPFRAAGFVVFSINYRLSPAFHFPAMNDDVETAIAWAKAHAAEYKGDEKRVALVGDSAGGYLVTYAAAHGAQSVNAVVGIYPPTNLESRVRKSGKMMTAGSLTGLTEVTDETFEKLHAISPIYMIHPQMPPHLILHGDKDPQVPYEQSVEFQNKMVELGNACELITIPGGAHGLSTWDKLSREYRKPIIAWLTKTLK